MALSSARLAGALAVLVASACASQPGCGESTARPCAAPARPPPAHLVALERVFPRVEVREGVALVQSPELGRWYLATLGGSIYTFAGQGEAGASRFVELGARVAKDAEAGLLGMALHPRFPENGHVYLSYTTPGGTGPFRSRISRMTSRDGGRTLDPATETVVLEVDQPYVNHNGGGIGFGPDGFLYIGLGDGGAGSDPHGHGQNTDTLLGSMLRIDVDGGTPYAIPADNPFAGGGGRPEIFAWGLRNPWRWSFDRQTGKLWAGDVGQNLWEEIDIVERGKNYGWNVKEGPVCFGSDSCDEAALAAPVAAYLTMRAASVVGGYVYRGSAIPALAGKFVYSDFVQGSMWAVGEDGGEPVPLHDSAGRGVSAYAEDAAGEIYAVGFGGGIHRLVPVAGGGDSSFPVLLSQTGCVDVRDPARAPGHVVPYEVNVPFWSDGAKKTRWMSLPDDASIGVDASGDWDLPAGTVLVKNFWLDERPIETRLLVRHDDDGGWAGYSYAWNDDGSDAQLLTQGQTRSIGEEKSWLFPSRGECMFCHSEAAGRTLGLEAAQLDRVVTGREGGPTHQIDWFDAHGLLAARPSVSPLPEIASDAPLEARARAYLHANCSFCHRPDGPGGRANMNLLYTTPFAETGLCEAPPRAGDLGLTDARLVVPGDPARSILSARMHSLGGTRMPALASGVVDEQGAALVDAWIAALPGCPP